MRLEYTRPPPLPRRADLVKETSPQSFLSGIGNVEVIEAD